MNDSFMKMGLGKNKKTLIAVIAVLLIIPAAVGIVSRLQVKNEPSVLAANDVNGLIEEVGKFMTLPNETPTVATVSDVSKLANQEFFSEAENGDKVIIFPKAQKAILYRPSSKKIIEVAFYDASVVSPAATQEGAPSPTPGINLLELLNRPSETPEPSVSPSITGQASPVPSSAGSPIPTP